MNPSILSKLEQLSARHQEVSALLANLNIINDQERFWALSKEYAQLQPVARNFAAYQQLLQEQAAAREMARESDPELRALAEDELLALDGRFEALEQELQALLLPSDPHDNSNTFLEIRAGTGGDEAALFAGDLFRMYSRYAELRRSSKLALYHVPLFLFPYIPTGRGIMVNVSLPFQV